jgi:hypothetical protein
MKKLIIFIFLIPYISFSQVIDNFNDGDFIQNPIWIGNDTSFVVDNFQLRSNGPQIASSKIYLSTSNSMIDSAEWNFLIDLKFGPSSTNFVRVYLVSDDVNLSNATNAYYIHIGQASGNNNISFYKKQAGISTLLFNGSTSFTSSTSLKVRLKITHNNNGVWNILSDKTGGTTFITEGNSFIDNSITSSNYFGFYCQYATASRYNLYYFDDVSIENMIVDNIAPTVNSVLVNNINSLDVYFSEDVDETTSQNIVNYQVSNGIGNPVSAVKDLINKSLIHLGFAQNFNSNINYQINVSNIADLKGNVMLPISKNFSYYESKLFDIVINEIMTDQNPTSPTLPEADYVEIYNRSNLPINLNNWKIKLKDDAAFLNIGNISILPDSFLILTSNTNITALASFCSNIFGFSSFTINNETSITIADANGKTIHNVNYNKGWYNDVSKQEGGWSLEQIDPNNPCGESANWRASVDLKGGTPGKKNSVFAPNPDLISPAISRICVLNKYSIKVSFNEKMNPDKLENISAYQVNNNLHINSIVTASNELNTVELVFNDSIQNQLVYTLNIIDTLTDCAGNFIAINSSGKFAFPIVSQVNDVIINEILFNPKDDGVDFVEIFNRSNKNIDLSTLYISSLDPNTNKLKSMYPISTDCGTLFSKEYLVLTTNPEKVKQQYNTENKFNFIRMSSLPSFNNDMGVVVISHSDSSIIDRFDYEESMHFPLLTIVDGVSLERINSEKLSQEKQNWHSAAQSVGFATPAYQNSQYSEFLYMEDPITIFPEIFSPDNDGYNDVLNIGYQFATSGYIANVRIFDAKGRFIKQLIKNELLGTKGGFIWDGIDDSNQKALIGIYIVYIEVFDMNGNTKSFKKTAVLGGKF